MDEAADPPAMLLGFGETTLVALADGEGFSVKSRHPNVVVTEILDPSSLIAARNDRHNALMQPDVDSKLRDGLMPDLVISWRGATRYFSVFGKGLVGPPATFIDAKSGGKSKKDDATLQVVVVKEKPIKLGIRNLQVFDGGNGFVNHAKTPSVPDKDVSSINAVWTPQANIAFKLVSSDPLIIDERDPDTQKELVAAYGLKAGSVAQIGEVISPHKLVNVFTKRNKTTAEFTIIVVRKAIDSAKNVVNGLTIPEGAFAVVTDLRELTTMAHEAGHYIGGHDSKGGWVDEPDWQTDNTRLLMRGGGAGWKIGFDFALKCRRFHAGS
jgi:hypothetical protein